MDDGYELIDAGGGRRLERFESVLLDRPAPAASAARRAPTAWTGAVTFRAGRGWAANDGSTTPAGEWAVPLAAMTMLASLASGGQVGVFPEHARNASWVRDAISRRLARGGEPPTVLNLFAYTGLLTLVAASAGAAVTHVDASRPAVQWARRNATANELDDHPIRWIIDDASAYLRREARRGHRYDGLILDPPSYGHGRDRGAGRAFEFDRDVDGLLRDALAVARPDSFWLLSTHTAGWDPARLGTTLATSLGVARAGIDAAPLELMATSGARLALGAAARFDPLASKPR